MGNWAVAATVEFATPRDDDKLKDFLNAVYTEALVRHRQGCAAARAGYRRADPGDSRAAQAAGPTGQAALDFFNRHSTKAARPMFFQFFDELRAARIPVTLKEYLALMEAMDKDVIDMKIEEFYYLSRTALVKDERNLDKFDQVFGHVFKGLEGLDGSLIAQIPEEWLKALTEKFLTEEEKKLIEKAGGWDKLMDPAEGADGGAEEAPREGQQGDRHRRHLALRQRRLQSRRRAHRPGQVAPRQGGQGLGQARVQEPRRFRRARHAQHQGGAAPPAQMGARRAPKSNWTCPARSRTRPTRAIST